MFNAECTNTQNPTSFPLLHFLPAFHYPPALAAPPSLGRVHYRPGQQRQARMPTCPMPRIGSFSKYFPAKGEKLPERKEGSWKGGKYCKMWRKLFEEEGKPAFLWWRLLARLSLPNPAACHHSLVGDILENASIVRSKGAFSTSPVSLGQRPANPASVLQCPPDRRGVRSGLFMDETPLKGTTGYLPPVSPPYNGHTAQLYTCYSMRGLHNTDTQYSESIQHGHVNSSHQ